MKYHFLIILIISVVSLSFGQITTPSTTRDKPKIKDFGSSLKKYDKKNKDKSENNQPNNKSSDEEIINVKTDLVVSDVLVVNQKGTIIPGLRQSDFIVIEDGIQQEIGLFSFGESAKIPRSIVLIIDYSTSLLPYIDNSIEAAKLLVNKLDSQDRMAIVTDDVKLLVDFTRDKELLKNTLEDLRKKCLGVKEGGKSWQYSSLLAVLNELIDEEDIRPIIIFQTDGDEFNFLKPIKYFSKEQQEKFPISCSFDIGYCERAYGFANIKEKIEKSRATIYSIIPGINFIGLSEEEKQREGEISIVNKLRLLIKGVKEDWLANYAKVNALDEAVIKSAWHESVIETAKLSGGYADFIEKPEDADKAYSTIFTTISNRYIIGYYPKNEVKDGKRRRVKIEVKGHPEYIFIGRKSYIAPNQ